MNVVELLRNSHHNHRVRDFFNYKILGRGGEAGQQGIVKPAKNRVGKVFAIKFARPTDTTPEIREKSTENFKREIGILATLHHRNIARIITGGTAQWKPAMRPSWDINEGFNGVEGKIIDDDSGILFYIMEFIKEDLEDVFGRLKDKSQKPFAAQDSLDRRACLFEELITQLCLAMEHYHSQGVTHKDIKIDNIRYSPTDRSFVLVDFGFARHEDSETVYPEVIPIKENNDQLAELARKFRLIDIYQLATVFSAVFDTVATRYDANRVSGIRATLKRAQSELESRYSSAQEFYRALCPYFLFLGREHLPFVLRLNEFLTPSLFGRFDTRVRIPVSGSILLSREVRNIIDTPDFQRLRGVRQLGPTMFVFPGATHTRFEHSLGVYWLTLRYLERVARSSSFRSLYPNLDEAIKLVTLAALLHDVGHYPYSHWIEEIGLQPSLFPSHERRAAEIIANGKIGQLVRSEWGLEEQDVANIIDRNNTPAQHTALNSLIDSEFDADKLDYLIRDSIHCGVDYGRGIDIERLLDSLYIHPDDERLCITDKGRSVLLAVLGARNIMYQEVYWHKTVRASQAMFKRFFYQYVRINRGALSEVQSATHFADELFLSFLLKKAEGDKQLFPLISPFAYGGRTLYKAAFVYSQRAKNRPAIKSFFNKLLSGAIDYAKLVRKSDKLARVLGIDPFELLLETVPVRDDETQKAEDIRIVRHDSLDKEEMVREPIGESLRSVNRYLMENKRAFVFCSEKHYAKLKKYSNEDWNEVFKQMLK